MRTSGTRRSCIEASSGRIVAWPTGRVSKRIGSAHEGSAADARSTVEIVNGDTPQLSVEDIILLLAAGADGPYALDPIRVMKGAFVASQAGRAAWKEQLHFRPYAYGP